MLPLFPPLKADIWYTVNVCIILNIIFYTDGSALTLSPSLFQLSPTDKTMDFQKHFRIRHYAGDVT